jgi:hypothetical protein
MRRRERKICRAQDSIAFWKQETYLESARPHGYARFGITVALSGNTLAVGADGDAGLAAMQGTHTGSRSKLASGGVPHRRRAETCGQ